MRHWIATIEHDFAHMEFAIRLAHKVDDHRIAVACDTNGGDVVMREQRQSEAAPALLRLPREAVEALRDALNGHMPPTDDRDLRDALQVERARVDRMLDAVLDREEPSRW